MKNKIIIGVSILLILVTLIFITLGDSKAVSEEEIENENITKDVIVNDKEVVVDIKGAVKKPGVYVISSDLRVNDVIKKAGGLLKNANTNYINLSAKVSDELVIWIYTNEEIKKLQLENNSTEYMIKECNCPIVDNTTCLNSINNGTSGSKVNINTASVDDLQTLEGIGESKAKSIIEYRNTNGKYKTIEDIKNVSGIGDSAFEKIKNNITV